MNNISPELREKIQELYDANVQLTNDNKTLKSTVKLRDEQLEELEEEINSLRSSSQKRLNEASSAAKTELESQLRRQREMLDERTNELCGVQLELDATKRALAEAQRTLEELESNPTVFERSEVVSEPSDSGEFAQLQEERDQLLFAIATAQHKEHSLKAELEELRCQYDMSQEEIADLKKNLKTSAAQIVELQCEISDVQANVAMASRGNSMFGEIADGYHKLAETATAVGAENRTLRKANARLTEEVEEARLLASKMEGVEKTGRCVCVEMQAEEAKRRIEVEHLQRRIHSLENDVARRAEKMKGQEQSAIYRSMLESLKGQLHSTNEIVTSLRLEKNKLLDKNIELTAMARRAATGEKNAKTRYDTIFQLYEGLKKSHKDDEDSGEKPEGASKPPAFPFSAKTPAPAKTTSTIDKQAHVTFETPAKPPLFTPAKPSLFLQQQTPAPIEDPLKRLSLARSFNMSEQRNETMTKQERRLAQGPQKKGLRVKELGSSSSIVRVNVTNEGVVSSAPTASNDTMSIFEKPKLPPARLNVQTASASTNLARKLFTAPPVAEQASVLNQTNHDNVSMNMDSTYNFDLDKAPFDVTALEGDSDQENVETTLP